MKTWQDYDFAKKVFNFNLVSAFLFVFSALIYFLKAKIFLDPDFGWALRLGQLILKSGIPRTDPFSYTMPSYPYVDYEWLTHVGMARLYSLSGYVGLALVYTIFFLITLFILVWSLDKKFAPLHILFVSATFFPYFGVRSQVITWLFFAVLCRIVLDEALWRRFKYLVPALFLLWANLHAGFIVGLVVLAIVAVQKRKITDIVIMLLSIFITLINPYGLRLWQEVWVSSSDLPIRFFIIEWRPIFFSVTSVGLILIAYCLALVVRYFKKYALYEILLFILIFIAAASSARNIPLFVIYAFIMLRKGIRNFGLEVGSNRRRLFRLKRVYVFFFIVVAIIAFFQMRGDYGAAATRREDRYYPKRAIDYLARNLPRGQILASYEWGGYLDWKFSQKKVFMDGRMASWRQKPIVGESAYVFAEFHSLLQLEQSLPRTFEKYNIDTVLLPRAWLVERKKDVTWETASRFVEELKKNKFDEVYQDQIAVVYSRKKPSTTLDN